MQVTGGEKSHSSCSRCGVGGVPAQWGHPQLTLQLPKTQDKKKKSQRVSPSNGDVTFKVPIYTECKKTPKGSWRGKFKILSQKAHLKPSSPPVSALCLSLPRDLIQCAHAMHTPHQALPRRPFGLSEPCQCCSEPTHHH